MLSHYERQPGWPAWLAIILLILLTEPTTAWSAETTLSGPTPSVSDEEASSISVVSIDELGRSQVKKLPTARYRNAMRSAFSTVRDSVVTVLDEHSGKQAMTGRRWLLQTIGVGLGVTGQIGLGPLISVTAAPRVRLVFSNSDNPVYPD